MGSFVWYENLTKDSNASQAFYSEVVGWKTQAFDGSSDYRMWVGSQGPLGGVMATTQAPPHWMGNVVVTNVEQSSAKVKELGGKILKSPAVVPTVSRFAIMADPQGGTLALFEPEEPMEAHDSNQEGEFCWSELVTTDSAKALEFYKQLFGWSVIQEMDMGDKGNYRVYGMNGQAIGGMMDAPPGAGFGPSWFYYAQTKDLDAALARVKKMGGKVMNGPMHVPGTGARIAQISDPQGAFFALHENAR